MIFSHENKRGWKALRTHGKPWLRTVATATAAALTWLTIGPSVGAAVAKTPRPVGHTRHLSKLEMHRIIGAQSAPPGGPIGGGPPSHVTSVSPNSGTPFSWEGALSDHAAPLDTGMMPPPTINTGNGNVTSSVPIVGWNVRGGRLKVNLSLVHNSQSTHNSELGHKWTHSYDIYLMPDPTTSSTMDIHWGDDQSYGFTQNIDGSYSAPTGIYDSLTVSGSGTSAVYTLTTKDQIAYSFSYISPNYS